jgi:hypothetical protein
MIFSEYCVVQAEQVLSCPISTAQAWNLTTWNQLNSGVVLSEIFSEITDYALSWSFRCSLTH